MRGYASATRSKPWTGVAWSGARARAREWSRANDLCKGGRQHASCKVEEQRSAMVGRRGAQTHVGARRRLGSEGKMEGNGKTARDGRSLYLDKAAGGPRHGELPDGAAPNPIGGRLGWKLERAPVSPGRKLLIKIKVVI